MSSDASYDEIRAELIRLLEDVDRRRITDSARLAADPILRRMGQMPTEGAIFEYITHLLRTDFPLHPVPLGEPPGSRGTGYVMNNTDGRGLYIKVKIEQRRTNEAHVISFHVSKHYRG